MRTSLDAPSHPGVQLVSVRIPLDVPSVSVRISLDVPSHSDVPSVSVRISLDVPSVSV